MTPWRHNTHHIELLLQLLIGIVDTELLKAVHLEHLKPIDVQYPNEWLLLSPPTLKDSIDHIDNPLEQVRVEVLRETITSIHSLEGTAR